MASQQPYRGRFAPSPTGPLHLGSLIAALASFLEARRHSGTWLVRMEDLDPPREQAGAADSILRSLEAHGLEWDEAILWQGQRHAAYREALATLSGRGILFECACTRASMGPGGHCGGTCRSGGTAQGPTATRISVAPDTHIQFDDALQGPQEDALGTSLPDFVLLRKDGLWAYQLAVVVDDAHQGITDIVRGSDLLDSTARQIFLQQQLDLATPNYCHFPVITNADGQKLSKQNQAPPLRDRDAAQNLRRALNFLGQAQPPGELGSPGEILAFALSQWQLAQVPGGAALYRPDCLE